MTHPVIIIPSIHWSFNHWFGPRRGCSLDLIIIRQLQLLFVLILSQTLPISSLFEIEWHIDWPFHKSSGHWNGFPSSNWIPSTAWESLLHGGRLRKPRWGRRCVGCRCIIQTLSLERGFGRFRPRKGHFMAHRIQFIHGGSKVFRFSAG